MNNIKTQDPQVTKTHWKILSNTNYFGSWDIPLRQYRDIIVQQPTKIAREISSLNITDKTARRQHIERVKKLNDNLSSTRKPQSSEILRLSGF